MASKAAISGANIYNRGGTSFAVFGSDGTTDALTGCTMKAVDKTTGSFFVGNGSSMTSLETDTTAVRVKYLEGFGDFSGHAKNFYVLNKGDTWTDADGDKHTSAGLLVGEEKAEYATLDLYVSPQGWLYLSGVTAGEKISFDLAIGGTRQGDAGSDTKNILLNSDDSGVYHFEGDATSGVQSRWADDDPDNGTTEAGISMDSSFDMKWLADTDPISDTVNISTAPQLAAMAWAVNNGVEGWDKANYKLTGNIDLGNFHWTPIGTDARPFMGTFDGRNAADTGNHTISNLRISAIDGVTAYGLFGVVQDAKITDLQLARDSFYHASADTLTNNRVNAADASGGAYEIESLNTVVVSQEADVMLGAVVGHATGSAIERVTVTDVPVNAVSTNAAGTAYLGGIVGLAENTDIINNKVLSVNALAANEYGFSATAPGHAWAGGIAGQVKGTRDVAAVVSGNAVTEANGKAVAVTATGPNGSHAGGIIGEGLEAAVFDNDFLSPNNNNNNIVTATSEGETFGPAYAGGLIGHIQNMGYGKVAAAEMVIKNVEVSATSGAKSAWAGGVIGKAYAANGVELTDLAVNGAKNVTATANEEAYAGRLAGQLNKARIINCSFDNTADVLVKVTSSGKRNVYAGGLVGCLNESGSVNSSGVWKVNISATTTATAWAGGLLGYADDTSITASHVNYKAPNTGADASGNFAVSTLTVSDAATTYAGGLAGEIVNPLDTLRTDAENTYKTNNAVSVTMTLPAENVTAGGLYGKINDALIGTSYARGYVITGPDFTKATNRVAGVAGVLESSELIAVYGVGAGGAVNNTYPGMYAVGEGNRFYGSYVLHTSFAPNPAQDGNAYANTFYVDAAGEAVINYMDAEHYSQPEAVVPVYVVTGTGSDARYELRKTYQDKTFKYTSLQAVKASEFSTGDMVNDSMWSLLHYYKKIIVVEDAINGITTQYEDRLGYGIDYNRINANLWGNWNDPAASSPKIFTLAIKPGTDYGHMKESESSFTEPGSRTYTSGARPYFTAEEQATLPSDDWFYSFKTWTVKSGGGTPQVWAPGADPRDITDADLTKQTIRLVMPNASLSATATFQRNDNWFRAQLNTALSAAITAALAKDATVEDHEKLGAQLDALLAEDKTAEATTLLLDNLDLGSFETADTVYGAFHTFLSAPTSSDATSPNTGSTFKQVYPNANTGLYGSITDKEMVIKQMVRDAVELVMTRDVFVAGSYEIPIETMAEADAPETEYIEKGKAGYVDIGVELFTSGNFNKYVASQYVYEKSGKPDEGDGADTTDNTRPGITSANGMTITVGTVFNANGDPTKPTALAAPNNDVKGDTYSHGTNGGVFISYIDPALADGSGLYQPATPEPDPDDPEAPAPEKPAAYNIWTEVEPTGSSYKCTLDNDKLVTTDGKKYVYLREVDENGYELITRMEVGVSALAAENVPVNVDEEGNSTSANTAIGNDESSETLRTDSHALWWGPIELGKAEPDAATDELYAVGANSGVRAKTVFTTQQISGAYADGIYLEVAASLFPEDYDNTTNNYRVIEKPDPEDPENEEKSIKFYEIPVDAANDATFTLGTEHGLIAPDEEDGFSGVVTRENFTDGDFRSGSLTYWPKDNIIVKAKYVNLLGEINAAAGDDALAEVETIIDHAHFAEVMGIDAQTKAYYDTIAAATAEGSPCLVDERIWDLKPAAGYANAAEVKTLFTDLVALKELADLVDANQTTIADLTAADKTLIAELTAQAKSLLAGTDPATGQALDKEQLEDNLNLMFTTAEALYKTLVGMRYDTIVITVESNYPDKVTVGSATGGNTPSDLIGKVNATIFGQDKVTPLMLFAAAPQEPTLSSDSYVVRKKAATTVTIATGGGVALDQVTKNGEGVSISSLNHSGNNYTLSLTANDTIENIQLKVVFKPEMKAVTLPTDFANAGLTANTVGGEIAYGSDLVLTIAPDAGYKVVPGTYIVSGGTLTSVTVDPDGKIVVKNVTTAVDLTNLPNADIVKSPADALTAYIDKLKALPKPQYTPESWVDLAKKVAEAAAVKAKAAIAVGETDGYETEDAKTEAIDAAYQALVTAQKALIKQYPITPGGVTIPDSSEKVLSAGDQTIYGTGTGDTVNYLQSGVVQIGTDYYVQEGKSVTLKATVADGNNLKSAAYKQAGTDKTAVVTGDDTFKITNVRGAITDITTVTDAKAFYVAADVAPANGAGTTGTRSDVSTFTLPPVNVTDITGTPTKATVTIAAAPTGTDFTVEVAITGNDAGTIQVGKSGGTLKEVTLPQTLIGIVSGNAGSQTVALTSDQLQAIVDAYNKGAENTPKIVVSTGTKVSAAVDYSGESGGTTTPTALEGVSGTATVPTYTIDPAAGKQVQAVVVDGVTVELPTEATDELATGGKKVTETATGFAVDPGVNHDFTVEFNTKMDDDAYGTAVIVWKNADNSNHTISVDADTAAPNTDKNDGIVANVYDIAVPSTVTGGEVTAASAATGDTTGKISHGTDAVITLTPASGQKVDLDAKAVISIDPVGAAAAADVTAGKTIGELIAGKVEGVQAQKDMVSGKVIITVAADKVTGPVTVTPADVFIEVNEDAWLTTIEGALDALKDSTDLGTAIEAAKDAVGFPYQTGGDAGKWDALTGTPDGGKLDAADALCDTLKDENGNWLVEVDGKPIDEDSDPAKAIAAVNEALQTGAAGLTGLTAFIDKAKTDLDSAIDALEVNSTQIAVQPAFVDEVWINDAVKPTKADITNDDGGLAVDEALVIDDIPLTPGDTVTKIKLTVGSEVKEITPAAAGMTVTTNPDGTKKITVPYATLTADSGANIDPGTAITKIELETADIPAYTAADTPGYDAGIVDTGNAPSLTINKGAGGTGVIIPGEDGITISDITPKTYFTYKGVAVNVLYAGQPHVVTIPATTGEGGNTDKYEGTVYVNTSDNEPLTGGKYETVITNAALEAAIFEELGTAVELANVTVTEVKVISDALPTSLTNAGKAAAGEGIKTTADTITVPTKGLSADADADLVIDNVTPEPGFDTAATTLHITDPNTGKQVNVTIPQAAAGTGEAPVTVKVTVQGQDDPETINYYLPEGVAGIGVTAGTTGGTDKVTVPGKTIAAILDALANAATGTPAYDAIITTGDLTGLTVEGVRTGYGLPDAVTKGVGIAETADLTIAPTTGDITIAATAGESLVIGNIATNADFTLDNVTLTVTTDAGQAITVAIPATLAASGTDPDIEQRTVTVSYSDGNGKPQTVRVPVTIPAAVSANAGTVTIPNDTLEAIIEAAVAKATGTKNESGPEAADITAITVNAKANGITLPTAAIQAPSGEGAPVVVVSTGKQAITGAAEETLLVNDAKTAADFIPDGVTIQVLVPDAEAESGEKLYALTIPAAYPDTTITEPLIATELDPATGEPTATTKEVDVAGQSGGAIAGDQSPYMITVPGATVQAIVDALTDAETPGSGSGDILSIAVSEDNFGHKLPAGVTGATGLEPGATPFVRTRPAVLTSEQEAIALRKGITVSNIKATEEGHSVTDAQITVGGDLGTIITVTPTGELSATKNGAPVTLPTDLAASVTEVSGENGPEPYTFDINANILTTILQAAGEDVDGVVTNVAVNTVKEPATPVDPDDPPDPGTPEPEPEKGQGSFAVSGVQPATELDKSPEVVRPIDDLVVDSIITAAASRLVGVTLTLEDGTTISIPKQNAAGPITVTTDDGQKKTATITEPITNPEGSAVDSESVVIPGQALEEILAAVLGDNAKAKAAAITAVSVDTEFATWQLPAAEDVLAAGRDGLTALTMTAKQPVSEPASTTASVVTPTTGTPYIAGDENRPLVAMIVEDSVVELAMTFTADANQTAGASEDNGLIVYHTLNTLSIGDVVFSADDLVEAGILTWTQGGDKEKDRTSKTGVVELNAMQLADYYETLTRSSELPDGREFPGLSELTLAFVPQNTQYQSFVEDYTYGKPDVENDGLLEIIGGEEALAGFDYIEFLADETTAPLRTAIEEQVRKLGEQFKPGGTESLSDENRSHLLDKLPVLEQLQKQIDDYRKAEQVGDEIDKLFDDYDTALTDYDLTSDVERLIADIDDGADGDATDDEKTNLDKIRAAIDDELEAALENVGNDYNDLASDGLRTDVADPASKLDALQRIKDALDKAELGDVDWVDKLINDLPASPNFIFYDGTPDTEDNSKTVSYNDGTPQTSNTDTISNDSTYAGKTVTERITELNVLEKALDKAQAAYDALSLDDQSALGDTAKNRLDNITKKFKEEQADLAKIFARDYLTTDTNHATAYNTGTGTDGTSAQSTNGLKADSTPAAITTGYVAYGELGDGARAAVDKLFHGPTIEELYQEVVGVPLVLTGSQTPAGDDDLEGLLKKLKDAYNELNENEYTEFGWNKIVSIYETARKDLQAQLDDKQTVNKSLSVNNRTVNTAISAMKAVKKLTDLAGDGDVSDALERLEQAYKSHNKGSYTDDNWTALTKIYEDAKKDIGNGVADKKTVGDLDGMVKKAANDMNAIPRISGGGGGEGEGDGDGDGDKLKIDPAANGTITAAPTEPRSGDEVTVTVTPDDGFKLESLVITDKDGKQIAFTDNGDSTYTFTKPDGLVTVTARFACLRDEHCPIHPYGDSDPKSWYHDGVHYCLENGLMIGTAPGVFEPNSNTSRAMIVVMLYRMEGSPAVSGTVPYADVPKGKWFSDAILWADTNGVVEGYGNGKFGTNDPITREQMALILYRYANFKGYDTTQTSALTGYSDVAQVHDWAREAVSWAHATGLITGRTETTLAPRRTAIRAEVATIFMRFCTTIVK